MQLTSSRSLVGQAQSNDGPIFDVDSIIINDWFVDDKVGHARWNFSEPCFVTSSDKAKPKKAGKQGRLSPVQVKGDV